MRKNMKLKSYTFFYIRIATYIRRMFHSYDFNDNGVLDREEFYKVLKSMIRQLAENQTDEEIDIIAKEATEKFELNKNGTIWNY